MPRRPSPTPPARGSASLLALAGLLLPAPAPAAGPGGVDGDLVFRVRADQGTFADANLQTPAALGQGVGGWADLSGQEHHATGSSQMLTTSDRLGGREVVRFQGYPQRLDVNDFVPVLPQTEDDFLSPITCLVVYDKPTEGGPYYQRLVASVGSDACVDYQSAAIAMTLGNVDADTDGALDALPEPAYTLWTYSGQPRYYSYLGLGHVVLKVWSCASDATLWGDIAEVALFTRVLTAAEQAAVRNYLALRYGLASTTTEVADVEAGQGTTHRLGGLGVAVSMREGPSSTSGQVTATLGSDPTGELPEGIARLLPDRTWTVTPSGLADYTAALTFDLGGFFGVRGNFHNLFVLRHEGNAWIDVSELPGVERYFEEPYLTLTGLDSFGEFAIGDRRTRHLIGIASIDGPWQSGGERPSLGPAFPNPFRSSTRLALDVPADGDVTVDIVDVAGRRVRTLVSGTRLAGRHGLEWDGRNEGGRRVAAGVYRAVLANDPRGSGRKLVILP